MIESDHNILVTFVYMFYPKSHEKIISKMCVEVET